VIGGGEAGGLTGAPVDQLQLTGIDHDRIARELLRELRYRQSAIQKNKRGVVLESVISSPLHTDKLRREYRESGMTGLNHRSRIGNRFGCPRRRIGNALCGTLCRQGRDSEEDQSGK